MVKYFRVILNNAQFKHFAKLWQSNQIMNLNDSYTKYIKITLERSVKPRTRVKLKMEGHIEHIALWDTLLHMVFSG